MELYNYPEIQTLIVQVIYLQCLTPSAVLEVWQLEPAKETVWLKVTEHRGDEIKSIVVLADKQEVPAKGYAARPLCDTTRYTALNLTDAEMAIRVLTGEFLLLREEEKP